MGTLLWSPFIIAEICFIKITTQMYFGDDSYSCGGVFLSH